MDTQHLTRIDNADQATWKPGETSAHGPVHLDVTDGERSLLLWRDVLGLEVLGEDDGGIRLGAGGKVLLVLHPGASTATSRGHAGLYHLAIHVPDAAEFAYVLARLDSARYPHSPTEHVFSKATYLDDLDGIGIEITLETPDRVKEVHSGPGGIELIDETGTARPGVGHLDLQEAMSHLDEKEIRPLKAGTWIGHVHLHITDMDEATRFYSDLLGYPTGLDYPGFGMTDVHFEGDFKHRLAFNVWQGPNAEQRPEGTAGLRSFTLVLPGQAELDATLKRLDEGGYPNEAQDDGYLVHDPAGNALLLVARPAG